MTRLTMLVDAAVNMDVVERRAVVVDKVAAVKMDVAAKRDVVRVADMKDAAERRAAARWAVVGADTAREKLAGRIARCVESAGASAAARLRCLFFAAARMSVLFAWRFFSPVLFARSPACSTVFHQLL